MAVNIQDGALSMLEMEQMTNSPQAKYILTSILNAGSFVEDMPLKIDQTRQIAGVRSQELPAIDWVGVNGNPTTFKNSPTPFNSQISVAAGNFEISRFLSGDKNVIQDPFKFQVDSYIKSFTHTVNNDLINGSAGVDVHGPVGIKYMLDNPNQYGLPTVSNTARGKIDAGAVDMTLAAMTEATFNTMMSYIDQLFDEMGAGAGTGVCLYMSEKMRRALFYGARRFSGQGGFETAKDQMGRVVDTYRGAKVKSAGRLRPTTNATNRSLQLEVLTNTETAAGALGSSAHTSIYAVKFGESDVMGWSWEEGILRVSSPYTLNGGNTQQVTIDGAIGLAVLNANSIGRIYGVKVS